jgi:hypothetical protein
MVRELKMDDDNDENGYSPGSGGWKEHFVVSIPTQSLSVISAGFRGGVTVGNL